MVSQEFKRACRGILNSTQKEFMGLARGLNKLNWQTAGNLPDFTVYTSAHNAFLSFIADSAVEKLDDLAYAEHSLDAMRELTAIFRRQARILTRNLPKDTPAKKTASQLRKKVNAMEENWRKFTELHYDMMLEAQESPDYKNSRLVMEYVDGMLATTIRSGIWRIERQPQPNPRTGKSQEYFYSGQMRKLAEIAPQLRALGFGS